MNTDIVLKITALNSNLAGILRFGTGGGMQFSEPFPEVLKGAVKQVVREGVSIVSELYDEKKRMYVLYREHVKASDARFPLALMKHFNNRGMLTVQEHPEVMSEIMHRLAAFPDVDPEKQEILNNLPKSTYLEQSAILEELRRL